MAKPIGTLGTIDTLTVGGRVFTDLTNLLILGGHQTAGSGGTKWTYRKMNSSSGYAVTGGKTLTVKAVSGTTTNIGTIAITSLQSDNDVGLDSSSSFTNPVYMIGDSAFKPFTVDSILTPYWQWDGGDFQVAAGKYLGALSSSGGESIFAKAYAYEA